MAEGETEKEAYPLCVSDAGTLERQVEISEGFFFSLATLPRFFQGPPFSRLH